MPETQQQFARSLVDAGETAAELGENAYLMWLFVVVVVALVVLDRVFTIRDARRRDKSELQSRHAAAEERRALEDRLAQERRESNEREARFVDSIVDINRNHASNGAKMAEVSRQIADAVTRTERAINAIYDRQDRHHGTLIGILRLGEDHCDGELRERLTELRHDAERGPELDRSPNH